VRARTFILLLLLAFVVAQGIFLFFKVPHLDGLFTVSFWRNMGKVGHVMLIAEEGYVSESKANFDSLGDNALHGLIGGLDSYSSYLTVPEFENYEIPTRQSYAGIGAEVREVEGKVFIMGLNPAGGAREAGFLPGDRIVEVDGEDVGAAGIAKIVSLLRGEAGTSVEVGVRRGDGDEILHKTVERRTLNVASVREVRMIGEEIGYLGVGVFGRNTSAEMAAAIGDLLSQGAEGLIIDLRNNPGGLLAAAKEVVDLFVPDGVEFLTVRGRDESVIERFFTEKPSAVPEEVSVVILQNRFSASASEIFAGVLQSLGRATLVGETSHGKGSVQSVYQFGGGDGLSMTTARYFLPSGEAIEGVGLEPDESVEIDEEEILRMSIQSNHDFGLSDREFEEKFGFSPVEDKTLRRAIEILRGDETEGMPDEESSSEAT